jgi:hypothetical protein
MRFHQIRRKEGQAIDEQQIRVRLIRGNCTGDVERRSVKWDLKAASCAVTGPQGMLSNSPIEVGFARK